MNSIELGRSVYGPAVSPYIIGAAVSRFLVAFGDYAPWPVLRDALSNAGWMLTVLCLIVLAFEMVAQWRNHQRILDREDAETALIAPPAPDPAPVAPKIAFPPMGFVSWIWDWREANGKFPTVRECVEAHKGWNGGMVQQWYQEMVNANAIINRLEKQAAGDPAPDWTRTRFEKAAADAATDYIT